MRRTVEYAAVLALTTSVMLVGCTESVPTMPVGDGSFFIHAPASGYDVVRRVDPLATDLTVTGVIGPEGGRLDIPEAGVFFIVPPDALDAPVEITMKALAGDASAVEFAPHGLVFERPATIHMRAEGTVKGQELRLKQNGVKLETFMGVYFEGDPRLGVKPLETIPTFYLDGAIVFEVEHFSGYATASG